MSFIDFQNLTVSKMELIDGRDKIYKVYVACGEMVGLYSINIESWLTSYSYKSIEKISKRVYALHTGTKTIDVYDIFSREVLIGGADSIEIQENTELIKVKKGEEEFIFNSGSESVNKSIDIHGLRATPTAKQGIFTLDDFAHFGEVEMMWFFPGRGVITHNGDTYMWARGKMCQVDRLSYVNQNSPYLTWQGKIVKELYPDIDKKLYIDNRNNLIYKDKVKKKDVKSVIRTFSYMAVVQNLDDTLQICTSKGKMYPQVYPKLSKDCGWFITIRVFPRIMDFEGGIKVAMKSKEGDRGRLDVWDASTLTFTAGWLIQRELVGGLSHTPVDIILYSGFYRVVQDEDVIYKSKNELKLEWEAEGGPQFIKIIEVGQDNKEYVIGLITED